MVRKPCLHGLGAELARSGSAAPLPFGGGEVCRVLDRAGRKAPGPLLFLFYEPAVTLSR